MDGDARLDSIMAALPAADAAWLADYLGVPRWVARRDRLDSRDAAVRQAIQALAPMRVKPATIRLAVALARYLATGWIVDRQRGHADPEPLRQALYEVARASGGKPLSQRQLYRIATGERTPEVP